MENNTEEKFGTIILGGRIYNIDSMTAKELEELEKTVKQQIEDKKAEIEKYIK